MSESRRFWAKGRARATAVALLIGASSVLILLCGVYASASARVAGKAIIKPPTSLASSKTITYCSEIDFPPLESYKGQTPVGADIDIGKAIAQLMGVKASYENLGFDALIAALQAGKCDAIISGLNVTPQRRKQIDLVEYVKIGQSLIVLKGNPDHISGLASLAGRNVGTVTGTTQATFLNQENSKLKAAGKKPISVTLFPSDTGALSALLTHRIDVDFDSATFAAVAVKQNPTAAIAGSPVNPVPDGIGIRKNDPSLDAALKKAVSKLYADGTMGRILSKWKLTSAALKPLG